jgi:hypothetical protein
METPQMLIACLRSLAMQSPVILACLFGCILVVVRWRSLRSAAWPAICGLGFALLLNVAFPLVWTIAAWTTSDRSDSRTIFTILPIALSVLSTIPWLLIILGIVLGRSSSAGPNASNSG